MFGYGPNYGYGGEWIWIIIIVFIIFFIFFNNRNNSLGNSSKCC